jgi:hypothetical protein
LLGLSHCIPRLTSRQHGPISLDIHLQCCIFFQLFTSFVSSDLTIYLSFVEYSFNCVKYSLSSYCFERYPEEAATQPYTFIIVCAIFLICSVKNFMVNKKRTNKSLQDVDALTSVLTEIFPHDIRQQQHHVHAQTNDSPSICVPLQLSNYSLVNSNSTMKYIDVM